MLTAHRVQVAALALKNRLPTISGLSEMVEAGGLMSYGPGLGDVHRLAATQVHKILKGAKPGDLPVEQPTKVINLKTAKALGLTIPRALLARADRGHRVMTRQPRGVVETATHLLQERGFQRVTDRQGTQPPAI